MKHEHSHHGLLVVSTFITIFVYALYAYMYFEINKSLDSVTALRHSVEKEQSYKQEEQNLTSVYSATVADRARLSKFLIKDDATVSFIETIESLGDRVGAVVTLSSIDADNLEGKSVGTQGHIRARVDVRGSWSAVMRTVSLAEILPYNISVTGLHLDSAGSSGPKTSAEWHASFALEASMIHLGSK